MQSYRMGSKTKLIHATATMSLIALRPDIRSPAFVKLRRWTLQAWSIKPQIMGKERCTLDLVHP